MKTTQLNPTTAALIESTEMAMSFKNAAKKFLKATVRFLIVISPAYPHYVERQKNYDGTT